MKTRFSPILKLKLSEVNKIELEIKEVGNLIFAKKQEIEALHKHISEFTPPDTQEYRKFLAFREMISNLREKIKEENSFLAMLESRKIDTIKRYDKAKIEYEKINYLHLKEAHDLLKKAQRRESLEQDELASIKYIAQKRAQEV